MKTLNSTFENAKYPVLEELTGIAMEAARTFADSKGYSIEFDGHPAVNLVNGYGHFFLKKQKKGGPPPADGAFGGSIAHVGAMNAHARVISRTIRPRCMYVRLIDSSTNHRFAAQTWILLYRTTSPAVSSQ